MNQLCDLLNNSFKNAGNNEFYYSGPWAVGFYERKYEMVFDVYYKKIPVLSGTNFDKSIMLCTSERIYSYDKLIQAVNEALPEYHFKGEIFEKHISQKSYTDINKLIEFTEKSKKNTQRYEEIKKSPLDLAMKAY